MLILSMICSLIVPVGVSAVETELPAAVGLVDVIEILKSMAGMKSIYSGTDIFPTLVDAIEILKHMAGMRERPVLPLERLQTEPIIPEPDPSCECGCCEDCDKCGTCEVCDPPCECGCCKDCGKCGTCEVCIPPCECGCCEECGECGTCEVCIPPCEDCDEQDCICIDFTLMSYCILKRQRENPRGIQVFTAQSVEELQAIFEQNNDDSRSISY